MSVASVRGVTTVLPATLWQRPMNPDDAASWAELLAAVEEVDRRGENHDVDDCTEDLADPDLDLPADTVLVLDGDVPVAYQVLRRRGRGDEAGAERTLTSDAAVHPAHRGRGIGSALVAAARRRADELDVGLRLHVAESNPGAVALARDTGLVPVRWWSELVRDLASPVTASPMPDGLTLYPVGPSYDAARWDEPLRAAHNAAFADHWGSATIGAQAWSHGRTGTRNFRPECSAAACDPSGDVMGYVISYEFVADTARTGVRELYVAMVGTLAAWRGRGVASALLAYALAAAAAGYARSSLTVDTQNPTGALGVYERAGYVLHRRAATYAPRG